MMWLYTHPSPTLPAIQNAGVDKLMLHVMKSGRHGGYISTYVANM
jgi:hypothetical protein